MNGEPVRPHVSATRPDVDRLLDVLLATACRVDGLEDAAAAAAAQPDAVIVSGAGDRFGRSAWRVGAATAGGVTAAALEDAEGRRRAAERALTTARTDEATAADALAAARRRAAEVAEQLERNDRRFTAASESLARLHAERREIAVEQEPLVTRCDELAATVAAERQRITELEAVMPGLEAGESAEAEAVRNQHELRAGLDARVAVLSGQAARARGPRRGPAGAGGRVGTAARRDRTSPAR